MCCATFRKHPEGIHAATFRAVPIEASSPSSFFFFFFSFHFFLCLLSLLLSIFIFFFFYYYYSFFFTPQTPQIKAAKARAAARAAEVSGCMPTIDWGEDAEKKALGRARLVCGRLPNPAKYRSGKRRPDLEGPARTRQPVLLLDVELPPQGRVAQAIPPW